MVSHGAHESCILVLFVLLSDRRNCVESAKSQQINEIGRLRFFGK